MNILNFLNAPPHLYTDPLDQHRARGLRAFSFFLLGLGVVGGFLALFVFGVDPQLPITLILISALIVLAVVLLFLLRVGQVNVAGGLAVGVGMVASWISIYFNGIETTAIVVLSLPIALAGVLFGRRTTLLVTTITLLGGVVVAGLQSFQAGLGFTLNQFVARALVLLGFLGLIQWLFASEFREAFARALQAENRMSLALSLSERLSQWTARDDLLNEFAALLQNTLGLQQVLILLQDEYNAEALRAYGAVGLAARRALTEGFTVPVQSLNPYAYVYRNVESRLIRSGDRENLRQNFFPGSNSALILPLVVGEDVLGVVDLQSAEPDGFSPEIVALLEALMRQFAVTLRASLQSAQLAQAQQENASLSLRLESHMDEILRLRQQAVGVVWGRFFQERGADVVGYDLEVGQEAPSPAEAISDTVEDTLHSGQVRIHEQEGGYLLTIPVRLRGQVLGAMEFFVPQQGSPPSRLVELGTTVAERLSLALDNARLVEQTRTFALRERRVGAIAAELQSAATLEELLNRAAAEFNAALGGEQTRIRLQVHDDAPDTPANGGGAA